MKIELNDETLTAYALGELDAAESKAVEKMLAEAAHTGNDVPRKALEEIRATVALAEGAFAETAEDSALTIDQRRNVYMLADAKKLTHASRSTYIWQALAATVLLLIGAAIIMPAFSRAREAYSSPEGRRAIGALMAQQEAEEAAQHLRPAVPLETPAKDDLRYQAGGKAAEVGVDQPAPVSDSDGLPEAPAAPPPPASAMFSGAAVALNDTASTSTQMREQAANVQQRVDTEQLHSLGYLYDEEKNRLEAVGYGDRVADSRAPQAAKARTQVAVAEGSRYGYELRRTSPETPGSESYQQIIDNNFVRVSDQPLSTFSIDVDTASYANVRRFLDSGQLPPPDAVRVEELINYFDYAYPAPEDGRPFAAHFEAAACPWAPANTIVRIGLKGREVPRAQRPATNLVFLIDVSGSMEPENKLPLVKRALAMLTRQLDERDRVTIVTYANGVNLALPVTNATRQDAILGAIERLGAGGSTNGAGGIQLAYQSARENFLPGGVNRVILATDGDFNVGISDNESLLTLIQQEAKSGVFLSIFGFGMGNLKDDKLEMLADKGNGVYGYIDSESEARKVFVEKLSGTLVTIAKDVKIQVEFNPSRVAAYRLIGYENRALAAQDFNDDRKDAGEIGAGHTVTALYEVVPAGKGIPAASGVDALRYQNSAAALQNEAARAIAPAGEPAHTGELLLVKLRYKEPEGAQSKLLEFPLKDQIAESPSADLKFASAVAAFGKILRGNPAGSVLTYDGMMQLAQAGLAASDDPRRAEMIHLMLQARPLIEGQNPATADLSRRRYVQ